MFVKAELKKLAIVIFGFFLIFTSCEATAGKSRASYPKKLHGIWQMGYEPCKLPGDLDNDGRIEIKSAILNAYEDDSIPLKVTAVSNSPDAWRITYLLRIDGYSDRYSAVFALSGRHTLTIIDESRPAIYTRCT